MAASKWPASYIVFVAMVGLAICSAHILPSSKPTTAESRGHDDHDEHNKAAAAHVLCSTGGCGGCLPGCNHKCNCPGVGCGGCGGCGCCPGYGVPGNRHCGGASLPHYDGPYCGCYCGVASGQGQPQPSKGQFGQFNQKNNS